MDRTSLTVRLAATLLVGLSATVGMVAAQPSTAPLERVTFDEAIARAMEKNLTIAEAGTAITRAEGLLRQATAATRPALSAVVNNVVLDRGVAFGNQTVVPRTQMTLSANVTMPVLAAAQWAAVDHARDQIDLARLSATDVRKQIAVAAAQAYLAIITEERQLEVNMRALETAQAHLDYAQRRLASGAGTRLNELRAAQEVSTDEARLENTRLAVRLAQEALGVLMAANGPVDAAGEPTFDVPAASAINDEAAWMSARSDVRLFAATERAAERVWRDSFKDYFPPVLASFTPQGLAPSGLFQPSRTWRLTFSLAQPIFDAGERRGAARVREAALRSSTLSLTSLQIQARSEVRTTEESVQSSERALASIRLAAQQANEVLMISNTAFEAGATTNLEVIDAQRSARDAEASVAIAEDAVRRARLDLLTALGRFPR